MMQMTREQALALIRSRVRMGEGLTNGQAKVLLESYDKERAKLSRDDDHGPRAA
jgi:hypothetical protein